MSDFLPRTVIALGYHPAAFSTAIAFLHSLQMDDNCPRALKVDWLKAKNSKPLNSQQQCNNIFWHPAVPPGHSFFNEC